MTKDWTIKWSFDGNAVSLHLPLTGWYLDQRAEKIRASLEKDSGKPWVLRRDDAKRLIEVVLA